MSSPIRDLNIITGYYMPMVDGHWKKWTMYTYEEDLNTQSIAMHLESISCHTGPRMEKALPLEVAKVIVSGQNAVYNGCDSTYVPLQST